MPSVKPHKIPCKTVFSNGMEFEMFLERCETCTRYRNSRCRIVQACNRAMWDSKYFPYDDLNDWSDGYGGKTCKHYTEEPQTRNRTTRQTKGQMSFI